MEFFDRVPTYPGRVTMTPVPGKPNTYDMVRADEPLVEGTPLNKALFQTFADEMNAIMQQTADILFEITHLAKVGDLAVGTVFGIYENGVLVPFIKLYNNFNNGEDTLVVRKSCVTQDVLMDSGSSQYENSKADLWLNNDYFSTLNVATQSVISPTSITAQGTMPYALSRKIFLLSLKEYNFNNNVTDTGFTELGANVPYFSSAERRIATFNGTPTNYWTRSHEYYDKTAGCVTADGSFMPGKTNTFVAGIRPAFTLPYDYEVTVGVPSTANTMATAEVI